MAVLEAWTTIADAGTFSAEYEFAGEAYAWAWLAEAAAMAKKAGLGAIE